jgi:DNA-directed RNA polymerase specialized sigma24 family protein
MGVRFSPDLEVIMSKLFPRIATANTGDATTAADAAQETFLAALRNAADYRE